MYSGESGNCMHVNGSLHIVLGSDYCNMNGKDVFGSPIAIDGLEHFTISLPGSCLKTSLPIRRDFRDYSSQEQQMFFNALNKLRQQPSLMSRKNKYYDYVQVHNMGNLWFHGSPHFLPWHRLFLSLFEQDLRNISGNKSLTLPYWSWGGDSSTWFKKSGILSPTLFGTTGSLQNSYCVNDGFMNGTWVPVDGQSNPCLMRTYNATNETSLYNEEW
jgi:hypothetical protein